MISVFLRPSDLDGVFDKVNKFSSISLRFILGAAGSGFNSGLALLLLYDLSDVARRARSSLCS